MGQGTQNEGLQKLGIFIGAAAAITAAVIGIIPWIVDGDTNTPQRDEPRDTSNETQREFVPESQPITVSISTTLGPNQYAESIDIYIEGGT